jgi:hypothetical protein
MRPPSRKAHHRRHQLHSDPSSTRDAAHREAEARSAEIIRWLPLLAANDFLAPDDCLPPWPDV